MSERFCSNCRAELPPRATACPNCGVFAGDVFSGRVSKPQRRPESKWTSLLVVILLLAAAAAGWWYWPKHPGAPAVRFDTSPIHVVPDRPGATPRPAGATISEAEAIRAVRRSLSDRVNAECLVVTSQGYQNGVYRLTAFDRCLGTRLGRFRIDGQSGAVLR